MKQKDKAGRPDMDAFETAMRRASRTKDFFASFAYTEGAERERGQTPAPTPPATPKA